MFTGPGRRPTAFLLFQNSLKHDPRSRFHKSLIGYVAPDRVIGSGRVRTLPHDRSDGCVHSLGTIGGSGAAWSTPIASLDRVHTAPMQQLTFRNSIHEASTLPYLQEHAQSRYKPVRALVWGPKVSAAAFHPSCGAHPSCAYGARAATQRSISFSLVQLLLRLPGLARRCGALGMCTLTRTMR